MVQPTWEDHDGSRDNFQIEIDAGVLGLSLPKEAS
jgi:hypothetical protein